MDVDDVMRELKPFGRYQILLIIHTSVFAMALPAALTMIMVFITSDPEAFNCKSSDQSFENFTLSHNDSVTTECYSVTDDGNMTACQDGWEYFNKYGDTSIVSEFDLVCDHRFFKDYAVTIAMTGLLVGAYPMGQLADVFGRKIVIFVSFLLYGVFGILMASVYNYFALVVMWFFLGIFRQGIMNSGYVIAIEQFPPERRALIGSLMNLDWAFGVVLLSVLAYFIRAWRHLMLVLSIGGLLALPFWWLIHESARWLLSQNRINDAEKIIHKIAKFNHIDKPLTFEKLPEAEKLKHTEINGNAHNDSDESGKDKNSTYKNLGSGEDDNQSHYGSEVKNNQKSYSELKTDEVESKTTKVTILDVFRNRNLAKNMLILIFNWVAASITYYGLSLNSTNLAGNKYLNFFLLSLVEVPAYVMCYFTLEHFGGRRLSLSLSMLFAGVACCVTAWIPETSASGKDLTTVVATFAMIGKFGISYAFAAVVVFSPEVFPTGVRSAANGLLSSCSRVGGMLAPFVVRLNDVNIYLPLNIFGAFSIAAGLLTLLLPETRNVPLPETLQDGEMLGKKKTKPAEAV